MISRIKYTTTAGQIQQMQGYKVDPKDGGVMQKLTIENKAIWMGKVKDMIPEVTLCC